MRFFSGLPPKHPRRAESPTSEAPVPQPNGPSQAPAPPLGDGRLEPIEKSPRGTKL